MGAIAKTDIELVEASLRGEHEAFGHLVARYQDVVCAVSYSSTGDQVLSEDVAQDTFIAAWRQLDRLRNGTRLRPWLCGIARNLARSARKRRRREELVDADEQAAQDASPFDAAARGDIERIVRDALARVPDAYREVLVLFYREDQSIREVAHALDLSETAVMQRLSRGRRYLADGVTDLDERSLRGERRRRDLVASVLAAIALIAIPSRVDASPLKGSTMFKSVLAATALVAAGTTVGVLMNDRDAELRATSGAKAPVTLHYGSSLLGLARAPTLGPTGAPRAIQSRSVAEADLALLPADSEAVLGINFAQVRQSALWKRHVAPKLLALAGVRELEALCGFDPLASLGTISMGLKGLGSDDEISVTGVIVIHGFDKAKATTCFDKHAIPDAEREGAKITVDDGIALITAADSHVALTFIDDTTMLAVIGPEAKTKERVARIAAGDSGLQNSPVFADALQVVNTDDSMWIMIAETSPLVTSINAANMAQFPTKVGTMYASVNATGTLAVGAGVRLGSPELATKAVSIVEDQLAKSPVTTMLGHYFDQLDVFADGTDLVVNLAMSGNQVDQLGLMFNVSVRTGDEVATGK